QKVGGRGTDGETNSKGGAGTEATPPKGMAFIAAPKGFFLDVREVTVAEYRACTSCVPAGRVTLTPQALRALGIDGDPEALKGAWEGRCNTVREAADHPVNCVKHDGALDYCERVGKRLPTDLEWSQAARGVPVARAFPWGDREPTCETSCFGLNGSCVGRQKVATCRVASHFSDRTPAGVLGLGGNVAEWVSTKAKDQANPSGPRLPIARGGSFFDEADRLSDRRPLPPSTAHVFIGFRCAQDAPADFSPSPRG
ncbi:MAG: SUMF1/EgtB/PvdO family nonheme iron enzyme, partial [Myxococcota bacterium]